MYTIYVFFGAPPQIEKANTNMIQQQLIGGLNEAQKFIGLADDSSTPLPFSLPLPYPSPLPIPISLFPSSFSFSLFSLSHLYVTLLLTTLQQYLQNSSSQCKNWKTNLDPINSTPSPSPPPPSPTPLNWETGTFHLQMKYWRYALERRRWKECRRGAREEQRWAVLFLSPFFLLYFICGRLIDYLGQMDSSQTSKSGTQQFQNKLWACVQDSRNRILLVFYFYYLFCFLKFFLMRKIRNPWHS